MSWILGALTVLFVLDAVRMRVRLGALHPLPPDDAPATAADVLAAPGVEVDAGTRAAAAAWARAEGLSAVDLVPERIPAFEALVLAQLVDLPSQRGDRLTRGVSAGYAIYADDELRARAEIEPPRDLVDLQQVARRLKHFAPRGFAHAVAERLPAERDAAPLPTPTPVLVIQAVVYALLVLGLSLEGSRGWGVAALAAFHLQPLLALAGTALRPDDLVPFTLFRLPLELVAWLRAAFGPRASGRPDPIDARRDTYTELLAEGTDRFFEPRRPDCPLCGSTRLSVQLRTVDLLQHKPGEFELDRCGACEHIFQNPRLSIEGLNFYYRDAYDGLGEEGMDLIFGHSGQPYRARAEAVRAAGHRPEAWLDVGGGHGHFCLLGRDVFPEARFDCLDLSESVEEAERRGWADTGYRGLFPELASELAEGYDAVSMSHYLEHTVDPEAEIAAAQTVLKEGGVLLIEVPDPASKLGRLLGRYWIPWFQPQHLHLLSVENLEKLLRAHGFEPQIWHRGEAHQKVDFMFAVFLFLHWLAGGRTPWRPPLSVAERVKQVVVYVLGAPFALLGALLDWVVAPLMRRPGWSNTYRVLARKVVSDGDAAPA